MINIIFFLQLFLFSWFIKSTLLINDNSVDYIFSLMDWKHLVRNKLSDIYKLNHYYIIA